MLNSILIKITETRKEKKISQHSMATQLNISQSYYNKLENGKIEISLKRALEVISIFEMDVIEFFHCVK
jgi:transcriptional regulator with XRE-family HTH domain